MGMFQGKNVDGSEKLQPEKKMNKPGGGWEEWALPAQLKAQRPLWGCKAENWGTLDFLSSSLPLPSPQTRWTQPINPHHLIATAEAYRVLR